MRKIDAEIEAIQIAIYVNVVHGMLSIHKDLSLNKTLVFAYLIKTDRYRLNSLYTARNTQDIISKAVSMLSGEYENYCNSVGFILKAIHLLIKNNEISYDGNTLSIVNAASGGKTIYSESPFLNKAIRESKKISDRQFLKEVTACV